MTTQCEKAFEEWQESKLHETIGSIKEVWEAAAKWRQAFDAKICEDRIPVMGVNNGIKTTKGYKDGIKNCVEEIRKAE